MTHYSLRVVDAEQAIHQFYECEYRNSLDAVEAAKGLVCDGNVEIWSDSWHVATVGKNCATLPMDPKFEELENGCA